MTTETKCLPKTKRSPRLALRLTAYAWAKLLFLRDLGDTEVGGFAISAADDLLLVEEIRLVQQRCTVATVKFNDASVADFFDRSVDEGLPPERFARIWVHTHPGESPHPSCTDEGTFARCFGRADWSMMFIVAQGGQTYARLHFRAGPGGDVEIPVEVDFSRPFHAAAHNDWEQEYIANVTGDSLGGFGSSTRLDRGLAEEFYGPFRSAMIPEEFGHFDPFLEDLDELDRPLSAASRISAATCH